MQGFQDIVWAGLRATVRHWRVALPLYFVGLVFGLLQTWPLLGAAARGALSNPFLGTLAAGGFEPTLDLILGNPSAARVTAGFWAAGTALLTLLYGAAYNFCAGGILSAYLERADRSFWAACRRTFWSFTGLGVLVLVLALGGVAIGALLGALIGQPAALIAAIVILQLINLIGEYARALAVARERRNPFVLIGQAVGFCARHLAGTLALGLVGVLLQLALLLIYRAVAGVLGGAPLVVAWQQIVVLAWLWVKLLRLAWAAAYVRGEQHQPTSVGDLQTVIQ